MEDDAAFEISAEERRRVEERLEAVLLPFVLVRDIELAAERLSAVGGLFELWIDSADDDLLVDHWRQISRQGKTVELGLDDEGNWTTSPEGSEDEPTVEVPTSLLSSLVKAILDEDASRRMAYAWVGGVVVGGFIGLTSDAEQLVGHLARTHRRDGEFALDSMESLHARHRKLHGLE